MKARSSKVVSMAIDFGVLSAAYLLAFAVRFDWLIPEQWFKVLMFLWPYVIIFEYLVMHYFDIPRFAKHYIGMHETKKILGMVSVSSFVLFLMRIIFGGGLLGFGHSLYLSLPIGVIIMNGIFLFLGITGIRVLRRLWFERSVSRRQSISEDDPVRTLLIGAGSAGAIITREILNRPDLNISPVGFLDDDPVKNKTIINGITVLGPINHLKTICEREDVKQVIITISNPHGKLVRDVSETCNKIGVEIKIVPGMYELVKGNVSLSRIRNVEITDLLRREPVQLDKTAIADKIKDKVVLVSGAGGSIGSEICRQICSFKPKRLVLLEHSENNLYYIHLELTRTFPQLDITPCIADVLDLVRLENAFSTYKPDIVYHAAAHKHVPMMEWNPGEALKNNIIGTKNLADFSDKHGVSAFIMISTDKAINPTSVMGATKRVSEIYIQSFSQRSKTRFITVRFGNVLGSAGSVVPLFKEQIRKGGPVTVTHPDMTRYFMTIPEASQLVLQASTMGQGGEIFILDMGEPVKIVDLANDLIRLSGFIPGDDIEITFTGIRPGEKLYEELAVKTENISKTKHPKVFIGQFRTYSWDEINEKVKDVLSVANNGSSDDIKSYLKNIVPEFQPFIEKPKEKAQ